jgi:hypothetical protein
MPKAIDHLTEPEAEQLAKKIAQFWHEKGHTGVRTWTEKTISNAAERANCYCVRSNLIRGLPRE